MSLARIRGHAQALAVIRRALEAGRLPHALLLSGPEGVGKRQVALEVAKALNCRAAGAAAEACDACASCRLADRGAHPDILAVAPEGRWLKIAQIRDVERHATLSPYAGRRKAAILDAAEAMTQEAANAFLKTLEDPPGGAVLFLISAAPTDLLPTIRSRCQEVRFGPVPEAELTDLLEAGGLDPAEAQRTAELGAAGVGQARRWAERFPRRMQDEVLEKTWACLPSAGGALTWAEQLAKMLAPERGQPDRDRTPLVLLLLGTWARRLATDGGPARAGAQDELWPGQRAVPRGAALDLYAAVARAQDALDHNANLRLTLEAMLLRMRAALGHRGTPAGPGLGRSAAPAEPAGAGARGAPSL